MVVLWSRWYRPMMLSTDECSVMLACTRTVLSMNAAAAGSLSSTRLHSKMHSS